MTLSIADCKLKLTMAQQWIHPNTLGGYIGIELENAPESSYRDAMTSLRNPGGPGCDYAIVKFYERGSPHHGDNLWVSFAEIDSIATSLSLGIAPYIYCHPESVVMDTVQAIACARAYGGVILDCEDEFLGHGTELYGLVHMVRQAVPLAVIIVSGYGDPVTRFPDGHGGTAWPFDAIAEANAYQPQFYIGQWDVYRFGWLRAIGWGDQQCGIAFEQYGLTRSFPITPLIGLQGLQEADIRPASDWLHESFGLSLGVWELEMMTPRILAMLHYYPKTPQPPVALHKVHDHFQGLSEFGGGFRDDCGPCAETVAIAAVAGGTPSPVYMTEIRRRDIAHMPPLFVAGQGNTIEQVFEDITTIDPYKVKAALFTNSSAEFLGTLCQQSILAGKVVILNLANAGALPHNEPGVKYHFVVLGGYDSHLGFLVANGDYWGGTSVIVTGETPLTWMHWDAITAAVPFAAIVLG